MKDKIVARLKIRRDGHYRRVEIEASVGQRLNEEESGDHLGDRTELKDEIRADRHSRCGIGSAGGKAPDRPAVIQCERHARRSGIIQPLPQEAKKPVRFIHATPPARGRNQAT